MALTSYQPLTILNQIQREMNRLFEARQSDNERLSSATCDWVPPVDIKEESNRFVMFADIPGVDAKDIEVSMENGMLTIKGERKPEAQGDDLRRSERLYGTFYRRFMMPDTADAEGISAQGRNGVLQIVIPKRAQAQPKRIRIAS